MAERTHFTGVPPKRDVDGTDNGQTLGALVPPRRLADPGVVYADDRLVVIEKPPGMLSVPGKGADKQDCAVARVREMFPKARGPMVVHLLDMETSGLLVVALDAPTQRALSMHFESRRVDKAYIALLEGIVETDEGIIDLPMRADLDNRPMQVIDHARGSAAATRWRVLAREVDRTRVRFEPVTGRTHQLRLHARAGLGHPIVGDPLYGTGGAGRLMLHATYLAFPGPDGARRLEFESRPGF